MFRIYNLLGSPKNLYRLPDSNQAAVAKCIGLSEVWFYAELVKSINAFRPPVS